MLSMKRIVIVCAVLGSALLGAYRVVAGSTSCPTQSAGACAGAATAVCAADPSGAACTPEQCNQRCGPTCDPSACVNR